MKRLLMISYPFPPNSSAGAVRSERIARYLPDRGWQVDVVTIKPRQDLFEDNARLTNFSPNVKIHSTRNVDPWLWLKSRRPVNPFFSAVRSMLMKIFSFPDHMLGWVPIAAGTGMEVCRQKNVDVIYTTSPPHSTHLAGYLIARMTRKPWVADFRDPWTLNAYRPKGSMDGLQNKIERRLESAVLKKASLILANTLSNRTNLLKNFPFLGQQKVIHLPNGWEKFPGTGSRRKNGRLFSIVHAGTFYPRFKPYALFYALSAWRNGTLGADAPPFEKNFQIILLGAGDSETNQVVQDLKLNDIVQLRPWVSQVEARRVMCEADLLWASLGFERESSTYIPSKLYEYIAAGRPILGFFPDGEASNLIKSTGTGVVFHRPDDLKIIHTLSRAIALDGEQCPGWFQPDANVIDSLQIEKIILKLSTVMEQIVLQTE
jgi:hypothetical protein